jgi:CRISPR-associated protein Cas1
MMPPAPNSIARRAQYQRSLDSRFCLALAINWVEAKILNSRRVLQRLAANRKECDISEANNALGGLVQKAAESASIDTLRGYEGAAAGRYFETFAGFFPEDCPFEYRSRRPPHNAANAILSFAYTLIASEMECILHAAGLDPAIGFLHEAADRRPSLALDMIEPFRAPIADAMAIDILSHKMLKPKEHFEKREGGIYLNQDGRKKFFMAYERRMNREYVSEQTGLRTTVRGELRNQAVALKAAIMNEEPFIPFLMN